MRDHLASANPVSLCVPMACEGSGNLHSGVTDSSHIGVNPLVEGEKHAMLATSWDRGCDFWPCGVTWALNDAPRTESQSAHEFSFSIAAPRNGPMGEQDDDYKDKYRPCFPFYARPGEELRGARGPYRQVSAISSTVSQLIKMIERHSLSEVKYIQTCEEIGPNILSGASTIAKMAICLSWSKADGEKCVRCSGLIALTEPKPKPVDVTTVLDLLNNQHLNAKGPFALHVAQHLSWDVCSNGEIRHFIESLLDLLQSVDPLSVTMLSDIFTEVCSRLLSRDPSHWAPLHRLLLDRLSLNSDPDSSAYQETCLLAVGGLGRQLAAGIQNTDPLILMGTSADPNGSSGRRRTLTTSRKSCPGADLAKFDASCGGDGCQQEFIYYDLLKETVAVLCRLGIVNRHWHSLVGETSIQIDKLSGILDSTTAFLLRNAKRQIARVLVEHLDPSVSQAFETVARIFRLDKLHVIRELTGPVFTFLVIKGTQESHMRIRELVELSSCLTSTQEYVAKVTQLCILPDALVYIFTHLSEHRRIEALKFLEAHLGISIEQVTRMNDVSRLLHQFVLCLYPHRAEACIGLRFLVNKALCPQTRPVHGLLLQQRQNADVQAESSASDVTPNGMGVFLQQHLCGILAFFDSRLLDDESPLEERRRCLLSLVIFMDLVGSQPVSRMRAKFIATLKLCLRYKFVESKTVVHLWTLFLKM
ncbi:unnamed protein product [Mesocestoides corti]|uniref:UME domain-containing protein n=2 Tax=Mesocestoides corti TaxID=53468 RepID=A0A0R3UQ53_MESCO|nr:unnamed protein product [Mesocestoides corti]